MRNEELQGLAGALLALLDGSASEVRTEKSLHISQSPSRSLLRRGGDTEPERSTAAALTVTEAEKPVWGEGAAASAFPVGETVRGTAPRFGAAAAETPTTSASGGTVGTFSVFSGEALEELDRRFRRDSHRYDSGFGREE